MLRFVRQFWYHSKDIICNERGNGGYSYRVIWDSYEKAKIDCEKYCPPQHPCSYCGGERKGIDIKISKLRDRPDEFKAPPPGARDLKVIAKKGGEEWVCEYTVKCQKCGAKETEEFWSNMYSSYTARGGREEGGGGCFVVTAACGASDSPEVLYLSAFRDDVLQSSIVGRRFVAFYYRVSPCLACVVSRSITLRRLARRVVIRPAIAAIRVGRGLRNR
jgi:hypothetical protein